MSQALLTSARYGDDDEIRELLTAASSPEQRDQLVNYVQEDTKNTPLHMGASTTFSVLYECVTCVRDISYLCGP